MGAILGVFEAIWRLPRLARYLHPEVPRFSVRSLKFWIVQRYTLSGWNFVGWSCIRSGLWFSTVPPSGYHKDPPKMKLSSGSSCQDVCPDKLSSKQSNTFKSTYTVATYDKKLHFLVRESQNFLDFWSEFWPDFWPDFWPGFWPGFWEGKIQEIQCTVLPDPKEKYKKFRKFRVSISYRRISYRASPPYGHRY